MTDRLRRFRSARSVAIAIALASVIAGCAAPLSHDHPALWHARAENGHELWIFGSLHRLPSAMSPAGTNLQSRIRASNGLVYRKVPVSNRMRSLTPSTSWFHGPVKTAFRRSPTLMIETADSITERDMFALAAKVNKQEKCRPIAEYMTSESQRQMRARVSDAAGDAGTMPETAAGALFAVTMLDSTQTAQSFDTGVDYWISVQAREAGKRIIALENVEDRLRVMHRAFEDEPCRSQARLLEDYVAARSAGETFDREDFIRLVEHWRNGDMEALERQFKRFGTDSDILSESLLAGRNRIWLPRILDQLEHSHSTFVVVGIAHLFGQDNLPDLLEQKGLNVERVQ